MKIKLRYIALGLSTFVLGVLSDRVYQYEMQLRQTAAEYEKLVIAMAEPLPMMRKK